MRALIVCVLGMGCSELEEEAVCPETTVCPTADEVGATDLSAEAVRWEAGEQAAGGEWGTGVAVFETAEDWADHLTDLGDLADPLPDLDHDTRDVWVLMLDGGGCHQPEETVLHAHATDTAAQLAVESLQDTASCEDVDYTCDQVWTHVFLVTVDAVVGGLDPDICVERVYSAG